MFLICILGLVYYFVNDDVEGYRFVVIIMFIARLDDKIDNLNKKE